MIVGRINFPKPQGLKCNMMPFIQGDPSSLPTEYRSYGGIVSTTFLEWGSIGFLTIDESYVMTGTSQRGYSRMGAKRNVHVEVGRRTGKNRWGGGSWAGKGNVILDDDTEVLIANSISGTCRYWDVKEMADTVDGDLAEHLHKYPEHTGNVMDAGEVARISIFTPHECLPQKHSGYRSFFRIVGKGVHGREEYFTPNPLLK